MADEPNVMQEALQEALQESQKEKDEKQSNQENIYRENKEPIKKE